MAQPVISLAKTTRPRLTTVLPRKRLLAMLDEAGERSIAWVVGPPGAGKTTLVSNFLEVRKFDHVWYQVDHDDRDVATFFYYMGQAVRKRGVDQYKALPVMSPEYSGDLTAFARGYFRALYGCLRKPFAVVFDNCHEAPGQSKFYDIIAAGLPEIPKGGCVIIISRADPPASMARFRANQKMQLIGWNDLRLTRDELDGIARARGERIPEENLDQLYEKTQGWAAGAVLMLEHTKMIGKTAEPPSSSIPQVIFDYLAGEIFEKFEPESQQFLLRTAYLPQMTVDAARELSEYPQAEALLLNLTRNDYFVTEKRTSDERIYQFHPLLQKFLLHKAEGAYSSDERTTLRRKAATLLEKSGRVDDAVALLLESADWQQAVSIILNCARDMLDQGRGETLGGWLDELPPQFLRAQPWLVYWQGIGRLYTAPRESRRLFELAYRIFDSREDKDYRGLILACCGVIDSVIHEFDDLSLLDRWVDTLELLGKTHAGNSGDDVETAITRSMFMALVLRKPEHPDFELWLERVQATVQPSTDPKLRILLEPLLAVSMMWAGRYSRALSTIESLRSAVEESDAPPFALVSLKYVESMYYMLIGEHQACRDAVEQALEIARNQGVRVWGDQLFAQGVAVCLEIGELECAEQLLREMESNGTRSRRLGRCLYHSLSAWSCLLRDDTLGAYENQREALTTAQEVGSPFFEVLCRLGWVQVLTAAGDTRKSETQLRRVIGSLSSLNSRLLEFMTHLTSALVASETGQRAQGVDALRTALKLGRQHGLTHVLWWRPRAMARLCAWALAEEVEVDYVQHLIRVRQLVPPRELADVAGWPWTFKLFALGRLRLLKDDKPLNLGGKSQSRPLELLKVLVALGGKEVRAEQLAETLWPHVDGDYAHASFTSALHRLRRLLGIDEAILLQDGRVTLNPSYFWLDTWAFERLLSGTDTEHAESPRLKMDERLTGIAQDLLQLYRGPFLEDEPNRACYIAFREHLRSRFVQYVGKLARRWEDINQWDRIIDHYERAIEADSLCEGLYRQLMVLYQKRGRTPEAMDVYDRCCKTFSALLSANPSPETTAVYKSITTS
jgi:LuxR family maltose regulon positive regulatory protein